jgi:lipoate-protein ligase A
MAMDEALAAFARDNEMCTLRVYGWRRPTLSFGRNQRAAGQYDREAARELGVDLVRRPTGGRAVLHHREITYCVTAPEHALGTLNESYGAINMLLLAALRGLGVDARLASPAGRPPRPDPAACFEQPVAGEIVADGRKLVGSAQWRGEGALLQHGSILVHDDQPLAARLRTSAVGQPAAAATLFDLTGREPTLDQAPSAFSAALDDLTGARTKAAPPGSAILDAMHERKGRFASDGWTWRR